MKTTILLVTLLSIYQNAADSGKATMYGGNLDGNACGMDGTADAYDNTHFVAIGSTNFDDGYGCGKCYSITCKGPYGDNPSCSCSGTVIVQAIDQCPECSDSHFDLNDDVLAELAGSSEMAGTCGVVEIEYSRVDCSAITSNFYIENKSGTSQHWYGFHLNDVNDDGGIKSIQLLKNGDTVATCDKSSGPSFWLCNGGGAITDESNLPLDIKITSDLGKSVTASGCITSFTGGQVMRCSTNLGGGSSSGTSDTTTTTTTTTTSSGSSGSSDGKIQIKQNKNVNEYWYAIEFPNGLDSSITNMEFRDSTHTSWVGGTWVDWGAYEWDHKAWGSDATFSGSQHFRVTTNDGMQATWNVFTGLSPESTAYINMPGSSYTEEDGDDTSSFPVAAIIAVVLLFCIITGIGAYCLIKRKQKAAVSFDDKSQNKGDTEDSDARPMQDGVDAKSDETAGYDMSPIDTTV